MLRIYVESTYVKESDNPGKRPMRLKFRENVRNVSKASALKPFQVRWADEFKADAGRLAFSLITYPGFPSPDRPMAEVATDTTAQCVLIVSFAEYDLAPTLSKLPTPYLWAE